MKKSIILFGVALITFSNISGASNNYPTLSTTKITVVEPTPLCLAISKGDTLFAKKLIEYGANINEKSNGMTPLMIAARYNSTEIISLLIDKGVDINEKDEKGLTALNYAERSNANAALALLKRK